MGPVTPLSGAFLFAAGESSVSSFSGTSGRSSNFRLRDDEPSALDPGCLLTTETPLGFTSFPIRVASALPQALLLSPLLPLAPSDYHLLKVSFISKNAPSSRSRIDSFKKSPYSPRDGVVGTRGQVSIGDTCTAGVEFLFTKCGTGNKSSFESD